VDPRSFDALTRTLSSSATRRSALAGLLAAAGVLAAPTPGEAGKRCRGATRRCGRTCVNVKTDPRNCGKCDNRCSSIERCHKGSCVHYCTLNTAATIPCGGKTTATAFCCTPDKGCCDTRCCP
jgi:hypothetical protein